MKSPYNPLCHVILLLNVDCEKIKKKPPEMCIYSKSFKTKISLTSLRDASFIWHSQRSGTCPISLWPGALTGDFFFQLNSLVKRILPFSWSPRAGLVNHKTSKKESCGPCRDISKDDVLRDNNGLLPLKASMFVKLTIEKRDEWYPWTEEDLISFHFLWVSSNLSRITIRCSL